MAVGDHELKAVGATISVVDEKKISDIEFEGYEQEFAALDSFIVKEVRKWIAQTTGHSQ